MIAPALLSVVLALLAGPAQGPYVVLRPDGTRILLMEPPQRKGALLVGRLWPEGTLVSFREREVDASATRSANAGGGPAATPTPTPAAESLAQIVARAGRPTPVPLGGVGKLNRSRAEVERELKKTSGTARPEEPPDAVAEATRPSARELEPVHRDVHGRGEEWWRERARRVRDEIASAKSELAIAEEEAERWERGWVPSTQVERSWWGYELQQRRDAVTRAKVRLGDAERRMSELEDEARKADAYPGWLR